MMWTQYPVKKDQENRENGRKRTGQVWSDAPLPGSKWAVADDDRAWVLVRRKPGTDDWYALDNEQHAARTKTAAHDR